MKRFDDGLEDMFPGINFKAWQREMERGDHERFWSHFSNLRCVDIPIRAEDELTIHDYDENDLKLLDLQMTTAYQELMVGPSMAEVLEKGLGADITVEAAPIPEEKERIDDVERRARKPPAEGPCKGCGKDKPLNRLFLCYPCWVSKMNKERGWRDGQPHPESCKCDLDCRFDRNESGN